MGSTLGDITKLLDGIAGRRVCMVLLALVFACALSAQVVPPLITNITNGAIPELDYPPARISLTPRSVATIIGVNLSDSVAATAVAWTEGLKRIFGANSSITFGSAEPR
jgi:hypothetical protein